MASLTQGVLSKLLNNAGNKDVKVTGEHRSALLQVIEILPSLTGGDNNDDPWQSRGFFLKLSDSLHSAYVSIADEEVDLIYSDKIQLGQFVYVTRLDSGSPVPVVRGLKPVPRRRACVGNPKDLVSSDLLQIRASVDFTKPACSNSKNGCKRVDFSAKSKTNKLVVFDAAKLRNGKKEALEMRRLSLDSARRVWDQSSTPKNGATRITTTVLSDKKAPSKHDSSVKRPSFSISPLKNKNLPFSPKSTGKPLKQGLKTSSEATIPNNLIKVPLNSKTWSDQRISWNSLPPSINDVGKEVVCHRNVAFLAAVRALEEASAQESVIHCMQTFAELCESSLKVAAGPLVEKFLDLHYSMQRAAMVVNSLLNTWLPEAKLSTYCNLQRLLPDMCKTLTGKNAISWVHAAIETDLSKFSLLKKPENSENVNGERCHYLVIDNSPMELNSENHSPQNKLSPQNHGSFLLDSSVKRVPSPSTQRLSATKKTNSEREDWSRGSGLKEAVSLVEKLLLVSREWFLKYLEDSLKRGFGLSREEESSEIACLLRQLKRVNHWLDNLVGSRVECDGRIEDVRKKLYGFLLDHVDSAVVTGK